MLKKLFLILGFFFFTLNHLNAQELIIKNKAVLIDGAKRFEIRKDKAVRNSFYLNDTDGKQLLYFRYVYWADDKPSYYEAYSANDLNTILFEEEYRWHFKRYIIKKLYDTRVITAKGIHKETLEILSQKIGKEFSRRRNNPYNQDQ